MKVIFVFAGIAPYFIPTLRKLSERGVDVSVIMPLGKTSKTIGAGVKLAASTSDFLRVIDTKEKGAWYGKQRLDSLHTILDKEKPNILIVGWPYFLQLFFERKILKSIQTNNIKLVIREIPFMVPPYGKVWSYCKEHKLFNENMELQSSKISFRIKAVITSLIRRWCYKHTDATLNYASLAYEILPSYGMKTENIFVTHNTTDTETLLRVQAESKELPLLLPVNKQRVIHIGRLVKWKRVDLLIDSFSMLLRDFPESELVIVGGGPELDHLIKQTEGLGIIDKVRFAGPVHEPMKLVKYMTESSIYVLAGMGGLSINDAMACGMPIVCSVCDGTEKDLVTDGENGLYFKENDAEDLFLKMSFLLSNPSEIARMGEKSKEVIATKVNLETVSNRYYEAFHKIVEMK